MSICCDISLVKRARAYNSLSSATAQTAFGEVKAAALMALFLFRNHPRNPTRPFIQHCLQYATMFIAKAGSHFACLPRLMRGFHWTSTPLAALGLIGVCANGQHVAKPPLLPSDVRTIIAAGHHVQVEKSLTVMLPGAYESVRDCSFTGCFRRLMIACRPVPKSWSASMRLAMWRLESTQPPFFSEFVMLAHPLGRRLSYLTSASLHGTRRHALPFTAPLRLLRVQPS